MAMFLCRLFSPLVLASAVCDALADSAAADTDDAADTREEVADASADDEDVVEARVEEGDDVGVMELPVLDAASGDRMELNN